MVEIRNFSTYRQKDQSPVTIPFGSDALGVIHITIWSWATIWHNVYGT